MIAVYYELVFSYEDIVYNGYRMQADLMYPKKIK